MVDVKKLKKTNLIRARALSSTHRVSRAIRHSFSYQSYFVAEVLLLQF